MNRLPRSIPVEANTRKGFPTSVTCSTVKRRTGGDATLETWDGMVHVRQLFFLGVFPESREAIDKVGEWVKKL
jgi:hypothetical protein